MSFIVTIKMSCYNSVSEQDLEHACTLVTGHQSSSHPWTTDCLLLEPVTRRPWSTDHTGPTGSSHVCSFHNLGPSFTFPLLWLVSNTALSIQFLVMENSDQSIPHSFFLSLYSLAASYLICYLWGMALKSLTCGLSHWSLLLPAIFRTMSFRGTGHRMVTAPWRHLHLLSHCFTKAIITKMFKKSFILKKSLLPSFKNFQVTLPFI